MIRRREQSYDHFLSYLESEFSHEPPEDPQSPDAAAFEAEIAALRDEAEMFKQRVRVLQEDNTALKGRCKAYEGMFNWRGVGVFFFILKGWGGLELNRVRSLG